MNEYQFIDLTVAISSMIINLLLAVMFILRSRGKEKEEYIIGIVFMLFGIPYITASIYNIVIGREWWSFVLLIPISAFMVIELFFDYIYKLNFRETRLLGIYLFFFYTGLLGIIGYTFLTVKELGVPLLCLYFINQLAAWYAHTRK